MWHGGTIIATMIWGKTERAHGHMIKAKQKRAPSGLPNKRGSRPGGLTNEGQRSQLKKWVLRIVELLNSLETNQSHSCNQLRFFGRVITVQSKLHISWSMRILEKGVKIEGWYQKGLTHWPPGFECFECIKCFLSEKEKVLAQKFENDWEKRRNNKKKREDDEEEKESFFHRLHQLAG